MNQILKEYSKDGSNKQINISAISEEEEKEHKVDYDNYKLGTDDDPLVDVYFEDH